MTEAQIKEQVGIHFFGMLAALNGYQVNLPTVDNGIDASLEMPDSYDRFNLRRRHIWSGCLISIQFKTTTEKQIVRETEFLKYDLDADNYNDLIFRRKQREEFRPNAAPLILVLIVLPPEKGKWLEINFSKNQFCLNGELFWFYPDENLKKTARKSTRRINILLKNKIDLSFFPNIFNLFYQTIN